MRSFLSFRNQLAENSCEFRAFRIKLVFSNRRKVAPRSKVFVVFTACGWKDVKGKSMIHCQRDGELIRCLQQTLPLLPASVSQCAVITVALLNSIVSK